MLIRLRSPSCAAPLPALPKLPPVSHSCCSQAAAAASPAGAAAACCPAGTAAPAEAALGHSDGLLLALRRPGCLKDGTTKRLLQCTKKHAHIHTQTMAAAPKENTWQGSRQTTGRYGAKTMFGWLLQSPRRTLLPRYFLVAGIQPGANLFSALVAHPPTCD